MLERHQAAVQQHRRPGRRSRTRSTATRTTSSATTASSRTPPVRSARASHGLPRRHRACRSSTRTKAKEAAAQYKQRDRQGPDVHVEPHRRPGHDPGRGADPADAASRTPGIKINLNPVADQSTLINIAIGRQFDATLWRNHPGADDDTQYVWWHCGNSPAAAPTRTARRVRQPGQLRRVQRPDHQQGLRQGPRSAPTRRPARSSTRTSTSEFAKQLWNLWAPVHAVDRRLQARTSTACSARTFPTAPAPFDGLADRPPGRAAIWCDGGKC